MNPRKTALGILVRMAIPFGGGQASGYSKLLIDSALRRDAGLAPADRALVSTLVLGVVERIITLDYYVSRLSSRPGEKIDPETLAALRLGLWQIVFADRIPDHAAVFETVSAVKKPSRGFVNGLLRNYLRRREEMNLPGGSSPGALSRRYSVCPGLCARYIEIFGPEKAESILAAGFERRLSIRTNSLKTTAEGLAEILSKEGFDATPLGCGTGFSISGGDGLPSAVADGLAFVQDEASQIAVAALGARPGEEILDVCACPGSKSFGAAVDMENRGRIVACDLHASKLPLIAKEAEKLGIGIIETVCRDSSVFEPSFGNRFDRVICDVPCSGYGVISKKPEIRYKDPASCSDLPALQAAILRAAADALRPGGTLVYSTCTTLPEENRDVTDAFLASRPEFRLTPFAAGDRASSDGILELLPDGGTDGFFIAKFTKTTV